MPITPIPTYYTYTHHKKNRLSNKNVEQPLFFQNVYNKRDFKACEARKSGVYLSVNEHFEGEHNAEITLLDMFYFFYLRSFSRSRISIKSFSSAEGSGSGAGAGAGASSSFFFIRRFITFTIIKTQNARIAKSTTCWMNAP